MEERGERLEQAPTLFIPLFVDNFTRRWQQLVIIATLNHMDIET